MKPKLTRKICFGRVTELIAKLASNFLPKWWIKLFGVVSVLVIGEIAGEKKFFNSRHLLEGTI